MADSLIARATVCNGPARPAVRPGRLRVRPRPVRRESRTIAVAMHDIGPANFDECALIRDWLHDHGVDRVTLLVIPAPDLLPLGNRRPELAAWLRSCERAGDAVAQHGFRHERSRPAPWPRSVAARLHGEEAEFAGLDRSDTRLAVDAGRRLLKLAGVDPRGFIAPAYAYTPALHEVLRDRFDWWAGLLCLHGRAPANRRSVGLPLRLAPAGLLRIGAGGAGSALRIDLRPSDLRRTRRMLALEALLRRSSGRTSVTYAELATH